MNCSIIIKNLLEKSDEKLKLLGTLETEDVVSY